MRDKVMSVLRRFAEENGYEYTEAGKVLSVNPWRYVKRIGKNLMVSWYYDPLDKGISCGFSCKVGKKWYYDGYYEKITDFSEQGILAVLKRCLDKSVVNAFKEVLYNR